MAIGRSIIIRQNLATQQLSFEQDEDKVLINWDIKEQGTNTTIHLIFYYLGEGSIPYPGDSRCLLPGQKSHAPFWQ